MARLAIIFALFFVSNASAESLTTSNVLPPLADFSTSGSTTSSAGSGCLAGEFCTGNASNGGGTYLSSFDVPLTESEVRRGFTLNSSSLVYSHSSNARVPSCVSITQSSDCRDIFELEIKLFDGSVIKEEFLHEVELDFSGERLFEFTDIVAENNFGPLTGTLSLFGIDAGFFSNFFGPKFSEPTLSIDYEKLVDQQVIAQINTDELLVVDLTPVAVPVIELPAIVQPPPPPVQIVSVSAMPDAPAPPPAPVAPIIAPIVPPSPQEAVVELEVEVEIEAAADEQTEPQTRQEKVKAAVEKVVARIAPSQRYSAASQTTMVVAMELLSPKFSGKEMPDTPDFFTPARIPDALSMVNRMQNYTYMGQSNGAHEALVQLDWQR